MQVKELRPLMAFKSLFSSPEAQLLQYKETRPATSRRVKRTHRGQGSNQITVVAFQPVQLAQASFLQKNQM